jgi:glycosyltransferase involved in cell wall biosynthesis
MAYKRFWIVAYPDIKKPIGGIKQLHRVSEIISSIGFESHLIQDDASFSPSWFSSNATTISKSDFFSNVLLSADVDVIILPETYIPIVHTIVDQSIPRIIFNQNSSYTYGIRSSQFYKPSAISSLYRLSSIKQVWCVSRYDQYFLSRSFSLLPANVRLITNDIDVSSLPSRVKKRHQIAYMPRKNSEDASIVIDLLKNSELASKWTVKPISNLAHYEVINLLQESLVFFSFGFPEGFGLPVAEAMACGCAVIGYDGLGGRELFKHAQQFSNISYPIEFGDWYAFIQALRSFTHNFELFENEILYSLGILSNVILSRYNFESMTRDIGEAISELNHQSS